MNILTCFVTGKKGIKSLWGIHIHHYIRQQEFKRNPKWFTDRGIKQRLIPLHYEVHADLHSAMTDERFFEKWGKHRTDLLFDRNNYSKNDALLLQGNLL